MSLHVLLGLLLGSRLLDLGLSGVRSLGHDLAAPVLSDLLSPLVVVGSDGLDDLGESVAVFSVDVRQGDGRASLQADEATETGLALDDAVWDAHSAAESGEEDNDLDGVDVVGDDDQGSLLLLDGGGDAVDTDGQGSLSGVSGVSLAGSLGLSSSQKSCLLLGSVFWSVLLGELEERGGGLSVKSVGELVDHWWDLESLLENGLLSLESDVLWPSHESGKIALGLDILADSKVLGSLFEERVLLFNLLLLLDEGGSGCHSSGLGLLSFWHL